MDGVFTDNKASGSGGVFYAGEGVSVEISQALVERNVGGDGGVVSASSPGDAFLVILVLRAAG